MRAAVARHGIDEMVSDAESAYRRSPEDSPWRSFCCLLRGVGEHLRGDAATARTHLEEGARRGAIAAPSVQSLCLAQLALLALEDGDWEQGPLLAARARAQVVRLGSERHPAAALVFAVSALVRAHRERVEDAQADRRHAIEVMTSLVDSVPWYDAEVRAVLARAALRLGDVTGTRTLLGEATRTLSREPAAVVLRGWVDELWGQVEAFTLTELVGPSSLTTAELRVLALMPTHLSFREMGAQLHVSGNTVKTHAHAVYRKLDVCSRSEAVVRARSTGLLDIPAASSKLIAQQVAVSPQGCVCRRSPNSRRPPSRSASGASSLTPACRSRLPWAALRRGWAEVSCSRRATTSWTRWRLASRWRSWSSARSRQGSCGSGGGPPAASARCCWRSRCSRPRSRWRERATRCSTASVWRSSPSSSRWGTSSSMPCRTAG